LLTFAIMFDSNLSFFKLVNNLFRTQRYINPNELGIKCFAVIDAFISIQEGKVDKDLSDKNKPFFWSQLWTASGFPSNNMSFEYPLLCIREVDYNISDPFNSNSKANRAFDILLVDKLFLQEAEMTNDLKRRNKFQIYEDCFYLLRQFMETLKLVNAYTYNGDIIYLPSSYVDNLLDSSAFVKNDVLSMKFRAKLAINDDYSINQFWGSGNNLYGVNLPEFRILLDNCTTDIIPPADTIVNFV
jgi:hypothetical protein